MSTKSHDSLRVSSQRLGMTGLAQSDVAGDCKEQYPFFIEGIRKPVIVI